MSLGTLKGVNVFNRAAGAGADILTTSEAGRLLAPLRHGLPVAYRVHFLLEAGQPDSVLNLVIGQGGVNRVGAMDNANPIVAGHWRAFVFSLAPGDDHVQFQCVTASQVAKLQVDPIPAAEL